MQLIVIRRCLATGLALHVALGMSAPSTIGAPPKVELVASTEPLTPAEQKQKFHLPPGFKIELLASEPEVRKPINLNFDAAGRLYISQSIEYPFPSREATPRDSILRMTDSNGDGVPDQVSTFASGLNIPIGVTPIADGVLGYSIPAIDRFRDTDGDGRADERTPFFREFGSHDTHGMASSLNWWIDGWVYGCHGFSNTSTVHGQDGQAITMQSGNTYRLRPDGSHIEYFTHGQVNPFGMAFDPLGNQYTADCHSKPIYMLLRGAYYPSFGKPDDGLGFGPDMISHSHNSTGICGVVYYDGDLFPAPYRNTVFICNPVTGRINHDQLAAHGSTCLAVEQPDFIECDDPWFRPVDIRLGLDGALYIADFYNRIIGHYEVPLTHPQRDRERGRIWRVSPETSSGATATPDLAKGDAAVLIRALGHPNLTVRTHATHQLVHRIGAAAVEPVRTALSAGARVDDSVNAAAQRAHGLWVLERLGALDENLVSRLAQDEDRLVRTHLIKALDLRATLSEPDQARIVTATQDADAFVRRAAVQALAAHPRHASIAPLLKVWETAPGDDTHLIHATRVALRDVLKADSQLADLDREFGRDADLARLAEVCLGFQSPAGGTFLARYVRGTGQRQGRAPALWAQAVRSLPDTELASLNSDWSNLRARQDVPNPTELVRVISRAYQERKTALPKELAEWQSTLVQALLNASGEGELKSGIELAREWRCEIAVPALLKLTGRESSKALRLPAAEALHALNAAQGLPRLTELMSDEDLPVAGRQRAAELLANTNSEASRAIAVRQIRLLPEQVQLSLARGLAGSREGAELLLSQGEQGAFPARMLKDSVVEGRLKAANPERATERLGVLLRDLPADDERVRQLIAARLAAWSKSQPDAGRGAEVFSKSCAGCHRVGSQGAKIGPALDGVGIRGAERLLEDVLDPNRNVDQAFRAATLLLTDGKILSGLVLREEGDLLVIANDQGLEVRVPKEQIEEQRVTRLSPMPANIAEQLPEASFYDLLQFLMNQRQVTATEPTR